MRTRRELVAGLVGAPALVGLERKTERPIAGGFVFESQERGHRIRDGAGYGRAAETRRVPVVIVGGGMAGLCAAWWLERSGFRDFVLLEMEAAAGGNSRFGENAVSAYPWGAHYIPVPNTESVLVREILTEVGAFVDGQWEERFLCHSPQERLYIHGRWQEGIEPEVGATRADHDEYRRFTERVAEFRATGAFTIPMALGEGRFGGRLAELDRMSFRAWLDREGFRSTYLRWFCDYSTRDDYGAGVAETSAWAGLHYFAAREHEEKGPLTWPEGNGWLLRKLTEKLGRYIRTGQMVRRVAREGAGWRVEAEGATWLAESVIFAAPTYLAPHLIEGFAPLPSLQYSPWVVSNLTLAQVPDGAGEVAWDNVIYGSPSLGYVSATHQSLRTRIERTVWTHYWALGGADPRQVRRNLLVSGWDQWRDRVLGDLRRAHPRIGDWVERVDIYRNGHAMCRPGVGMRGSEDLRRLREGLTGLQFAHADLSGFSIFEEAQYWGVRAATRTLGRIGGREKKADRMNQRN
ncbi:MAG: FAD-dependent oxidoreductase [Acidobacteriota bacterium]